MFTPRRFVQPSFLLRVLVLAALTGAMAAVCIVRSRRRQERKLDEAAVARWAEEGGATAG